MLNQGIGLFLIAVITGVPFYFQFWLNTRPNALSYEIDQKTSRLTIFIFAALILYSWIAVDAHDHRSSYLGLGASIISFMLLYSFRGKEAHQRRNIQLTPKDRLTLNFRTLTAMAFIFSTYGLTFEIVSSIFHPIIAIAAAFISIIAAAPVMIRILFPCTKMYESSLKSGFRALFKDAEAPIGEIYILNTQKTKVSNALVCGTRYGFGPFKRTLFLSENLFHLLDENELNSVLCHEAAHFQLHHLAKRAAWVFAGMLLGVAVTSIPIMIVTTLFNHAPNVKLTLNATLVITNVLVQFWMMAQVVRKQELEADAQALKLGATAKTLISALEKITTHNGADHKKQDFVTKLTIGSFHPSLEERKEALLSTVPMAKPIFELAA